MRFLELPPPDWTTLIGGSDATASWLSARMRKLAAAGALVPDIRSVATALEERNALFQCSPGVLRQVPLAARFYLDLLALTDKTVAVLAHKAAAAGASRKLTTIALNLEHGRRVSDADLTAFSRFINDDLRNVFADEWRSLDVACGMVMAVAGARIQGRVQNMAGDDAVVLLKTMLITSFENRGYSVETRSGGAEWEPLSAETNIIEQTGFRFGDCLVCEFLPGGNRPDITVALRDIVIAVGEVKGRKDLSNLWESWMPQISGHLRNWMFSHPEAKRLFFGTIVTSEMIEGVTAGGTQHAGLRVMKNNGMLATAYNLSLIASGVESARQAFDDLIDRLCELLDEVC